MTHSLVVATQNRGKLDELRALLSGLDLEIFTAKDILKKDVNVVEDGATFEENAKKKAVQISNATMMLTIADDSGLEVDALGGSPGVRSARFAGERATDAENNAALLAALDGLEVDPATGTRVEAGQSYPARFRCVLALVDPFVRDGEPVVVEGICEGKITRTPRGSGGFGYDPLFLVDGTDKTMAELGHDEKNRISHRARAFEKLRLVLEKVLAERDEQTRRVCG
ncbi:MAG: RdgB/HAM1 family non-canonical purine NTP pyrophosphatase [Deltaproteobacteria bacterium]|nr:RdgB/HAM1 family non-canonical purine NTP pyrophosphatase [Deltaproteobacteria bacterium]